MAGNIQITLRPSRSVRLNGPAVIKMVRYHRGKVILDVESVDGTRIACWDAPGKDGELTPPASVE